MTSRAWLLAAFLLVLCTFSVMAEDSTPATQTETVVNDVVGHYGANSPNQLNLGYNASDACSKAVSATNSFYSGSWSVESCSPIALGASSYWRTTTTGQGYFQGGLYHYAGCQSPSVESNSKCVLISYSCPSNGGWSLVGQSCVRDSCGPGEVRNEETGACSVPPPVCNIPADSVVTGGYYNIGTNANGSPPPSPCLSQCKTYFEGDGPHEVVINGIKTNFIKGFYYSIGEACSPETPIVDGLSGLPSSSCGAGMQQGTINGKTVCINPSTNTPVPTTPPSTTNQNKTVTQNPDGSTTTTETTQNPNGTTATTTTTTQPNGNSTTTTTTNEDPGEGDATEATQKEILDELKKTECEKNPDAFGCGDLNLNIIDVELPDQTVSVSINPVSVGGSGSCPADRVASFLGQQITVSWALPCQFANGIRPVVLSIAWLSAALILIGAFRQEG